MFWKALILVEHCHRDLEPLPFELIIGSKVIWQAYSEEQESWAGETAYYPQKRQTLPFLLSLPAFFSVPILGLVWPLCEAAQLTALAELLHSQFLVRSLSA